jgi:hypothetical protein
VLPGDRITEDANKFKDDFQVWLSEERNLFFEQGALQGSVSMGDSPETIRMQFQSQYQGDATEKQFRMARAQKTGRKGEKNKRGRKKDPNGAYNAAQDSFFQKTRFQRSERWKLLTM